MPLSEVGPYRLLRLLKSGGEGSVYVAEDRRLGRRVAVKLRPLPAEPDQRSAVIAEARLLASLNAPMTVQLYDVVELPDTLALVMEYVDGNDLEELLAVAELDVASSLQLAQDICTALAGAHAHGVIHGDLKPANVLVSRQGGIKLTDFGAAFRSTGCSASALSPEQVHGEAPEAASDLFALGCLLYRLLTGRHPFLDDASAEDLSARVCEATPASFSGLGLSFSDDLESLVFELLAKNPRSRPSTALQVRQRLLALARECPSGSGASLAELAERQRASGRGSGLEGQPAEKPVGQRFRSPGIAGGLAATAVVLAVMAMLSSLQTVAVVCEPAHISGQARLGAGELETLLENSVGAAPGLELAAVADEHLLLEVQCNEHVCVTQLLRRGPGLERADTRSLLPSANETAWRRRLEQGLRELYSR